MTLTACITNQQDRTVRVSIDGPSPFWVHIESYDKETSFTHRELAGVIHDLQQAHRDMVSYVKSSDYPDAELLAELGAK